MEELDRGQRSQSMGLHGERLAGWSQQIFFTPEDAENLRPPDSFEVDFDTRAEFDAAEMDSSAINQKLQALLAEGCGTIV
ncbi:MAG: hypothetical protein ACE5KF_10805, partial [Kiloniellaceae bacterium]